MTKTILHIGFLLIFICFPAWGQEINNVMPSSETAVELEKNIKHLVLTAKTENRIPNASDIQNLKSLIQTLEKKQHRFSNKLDFAEFVFYKVHRKLLKSYENHATPADVLVSGEYDCVSGTALYALIFDHFGFDYSIKEFDYHVLMILNLEEKNILLESTDPLKGFVKWQPEIEKRLNNYRLEGNPNQNKLPIGSNKQNLQEIKSIDNSISFKELIGLQFYNNAIYFYNLRQPDKTISSINKAINLYPSPRLEAFRSVALDSFMADATLSESEKSSLLISVARYLSVKR